HVGAVSPRSTNQLHDDVMAGKHLFIRADGIAKNHPRDFSMGWTLRMANDMPSSRRSQAPGRPNTDRRASATAWIGVSIAASFFLYEFMTRIEPSLAAQSI